MSDKVVFIYKDDKNDRDSVKYLGIGTFACNHYFSGIHLVGPCFSTSLDYEQPEFNTIKTVLNKSDFDQLLQYNKELDTLGCGIVKGDDRYIKGLELRKVIQPVIDKLLSEENNILIEEVEKEEFEALQVEHYLTIEEVQEIKDNYYLSYFDRGIVSHVYEEFKELQKEFAEECSTFLDYDDELPESYFELQSNRIVSLNY